jgi:hypothetical protein
MKSIVFWDVTQCSLAEHYRRFTFPPSSGYTTQQALGLLLDPEDAVRCYGTSIIFYQTTRRHIPEDSSS